MPGRYAKPIRLHVIEGNPNRLTKAEISSRLESEIKIGDPEIPEPMTVKRNRCAHEKWLEIVDIFKSTGADFVSSADISILEMYCVTWSEYQELLKVRKELKKQMREKDTDILKGSALSNKLNLENNINKKLDMLIKMQDRIYLNPLSRVRNIGRAKAPPEENPLQAAGFGNL
jgi:phage terminase small subunit